MKQKKRYVLVGTGGRAISFIEPLVTRHREHAELAALCDASPTRLEHYNALLAERLGDHAVPVYPADRFQEMLREQRPDVVIVTSKDSTHHDFIISAVRSGCDVITEKPMTIDAPKCRAVLDAAAETGRSVRVAFNYRWQAYRTRLKELLAGGAIGRVHAVNLEYVLDMRHGVDYYRRWHANLANSGGLLVHKSTHHFDLVNWWLDAIPDEVYARGQLDFYGRANAIARGDEALTRYARYTGEAAAAGDPYRLDLRDGGNLESLYLRAEPDSGYLRDRNVFRDDIDIYDNMSAVVRYRTGALLTYSLVSFSSREGMRVTFNGDRGTIEYHEYVGTHIIRGQSDAELDREQSQADRPVEFIRVYPHFRPGYDVPVDKPKGGHGGADPALMENLFAPAGAPDPFHRAAGQEQGAASILVGIAANESIATHRPVKLTDLVPLRPAARRLSELT
ncbi:MAG TPA: Gfo/Idh/MocA family oxidoreductase [Opitutaceae bacterium]|nr:Gfo/Idh/MocA family oxidoreductase [Opitutaceae bacterium]